MSHCPYCTFSLDDALAVSDNAIALPAAAPIAPGHVIIAPRFHVARFYDLDVQQQRAVWDLVCSVEKQMAKTLQVANFHLGFADAEPGLPQHVVLHVIPIFSGGFAYLPDGIEWVKDSI